jgi:glycosyltransferase involved in cell wall biosynthesis
MKKADARPKIAFLTSEPALDKQSHSGSLYYMGKALERHCDEVTYLDNVISRENKFAYLITEVAKKYHFKRQIAYKRLFFVAKKDAKLATRRLAGQHFDVIVAPDCVPLVAFLQTTTPILLPLDVTFRLQKDYYPQFTHLLPFSERQGEKVEQAAFQRASHLLFSSPWAARSAIEDYGIAPQKVHAIFWGANLDHVPPREQVQGKKLSGKCRLLFVGRFWERKGGDIACETLLKLHEMGIEAELILCGAQPPANLSHPGLKLVPFLDKNDEREARELEKLYAMSDFLILPTRADCVPNVIGEANAFGVPVIITSTGGIPDAVRDGENGYLFPCEARGEAYAQLIAELNSDGPRYQRLAQSSRAAFEEHLNWDSWGKAVRQIIEETIPT